MKRLSIIVSGKVQGVFYRASTEKEARRIGLSGFVQNQPDGSVYIEAQGSEKQLHDLMAWCRRGPERAIVESVKFSEIPLKDEWDFHIQR